jgi:hypothetical protein
LIEAALIDRATSVTLNNDHSQYELDKARLEAKRTRLTRLALALDGEGDDYETVLSELETVKQSLKALVKPSAIHPVDSDTVASLDLKGSYADRNKLHITLKSLVRVIYLDWNTLRADIHFRDGQVFEGIPIGSHMQQGTIARHTELADLTGIKITQFDTGTILSDTPAYGDEDINVVVVDESETDWGSPDRERTARSST